MLKVQFKKLLGVKKCKTFELQNFIMNQYFMFLFLKKELHHICLSLSGSM